MCSRGLNKQLWAIVMVWLMVATSFITVVDVVGSNPIREEPTVMQSGPVRMDFSFSRPEMKKDIDGYYKIEIEGLRGNGNPGMPILPFKTTKVLLPQNSEVESIKVITGNKITLPGEFKIAPGQKPVPLLPEEELLKIMPDALTKTLPDRAVYESAYPIPEKLYVNCGIQKFRGYNILIVNLYPVQYIPKTGEITYFESMTLEVTTGVTKTSSATDNLFRGLPRDADEVMGKIDNLEMINAYSIENAPRPATRSSSIVDPADSYPYVIITNNELKLGGGTYTFQDLAASKISKGLNATIVTVEEITSEPAYWDSNPLFNDTQAQIRNFIRDAYMDWETEYVLLGGDGDGAKVGNETGDAIIPARGFLAGDYDNIVSDLYYACLDGNFNNDEDPVWGETTDGLFGGEVDLVAEVYVGRAPVDNGTELSNFVMKTLAYDSSDNDPYLGNALMVGEWLGFGGPAEYGSASKEEIRYGTSNHEYTTVGIPPEYNVSTLYDNETFTFSSTDTINAINSNYHIINHLGHGNVYLVMKMNDYVTRTEEYNDTESLTNNKYFFGYSQACFPGAFDNRHAPATGTPWGFYRFDSIVEHLIVSDNGAFAFIANSRYGWGQFLSTDGPSQHFDREFFDALFGENMRCIAKANQDSKEDNIGYFYNYYGDSGWVMRFCYYELNLFGDPEIQIKHPVTPDHDLEVYDPGVPSYGIQGANIDIKPLIYNGGQNAENAVVNLSIDEITVDSTSFSLESFSYKRVTLNWTPLANGIYNVSVHVEIVPGETIIVNNWGNTTIIIGPDLAVTNLISPPEWVRVNSTASIEATIVNLGSTNETDVIVDFILNESIVDSTTIPSLNSGNSAHVAFNWMPTEYENMVVKIYVVPVPNETIISNNQQSEIVQVAVGSVVILDCDGYSPGFGVEYYYQDVLSANNFHCSIWDHLPLCQDASSMLNYDAVILYGTPFDQCNGYETRLQQELKTYLDNGGRLFITGNRVGEFLTQRGHTTNQFYDYLHAQYLGRTDLNIYELSGVPNDCIGDGLTLGIGGGNMERITSISPATDVFEYVDTPSIEDSRDASIAVENGNCHVVWQDDRHFRKEIFYKKYDNISKSWGPDWDVSSYGGSDAYNPSIAIDNGIIYIVWATENVMFTMFDGSIWTWPWQVSASAGGSDINHLNPSIIAENGSIYITWQDRGDGDYDIHYRKYDVTSRMWESEQELSSDTGIEDQFNPSMAVENGNVSVVWEEYGGGDADIYCRKFNGVSWEAEQEISSDAGTEAQNKPSTANENGNIYVVWEDYNDGDADIYYRKFNGVSWEAEQEISDDAETEVQNNPSIAVENGNIVTVWQENDGFYNDIYYQWFNVTSGIWEAKQEVSSDLGLENQLNPSIAVENGLVYVAWEDNYGGDFDIYYRMFNITDTNLEAGKITDSAFVWKQEQEISTDSGTEIQFDPSVAIDDVNGNVHVVWTDYGGGDSDIYYNKYNVTSNQWEVEQEISADAGTESQSTPVIAVENGNLHVVWVEKGADLYYRRFNATSGLWESKQNLSIAGSSPSIVAENGNVYIAYTSSPSPGDIYYKMYNATTKVWEAPFMISSDTGSGWQLSPSIAVENREVHVVWSEMDEYPEYKACYRKYNGSSVGDTSGFHFFTDAVDKTPFSSGWQTVDVSGDGVPAGATGVVLEFVNDGDAATNYRMCARHTSSIDDFYADNKASVRATGHIFAFCSLDANRQFEFAGENVADTKLKLHGYTDEAVSILTDFVNITSQYSGTGTWQTLDVSSYIPADATGVIIRVYSPAVGDTIMVRAFDSTDDWSNSQVINRGWQMCLVNHNNRQIKGYRSASNGEFWLVGYVKAPIKIFDNAVPISTSTTLSWTDTDVTSYTSSAANGAILVMRNTDTTFRYSQTRVKGSTNDWVTDCNIRNAGAYWQFTGVNSEQVLQQYVENNLQDLYLLGYCESPTGWEDEQYIDLTGTYSQSEPSIAVENENLHIVWSYGSAGNNLRYRRYNSTSELWEDVQTIRETADGYPSIVAEDGNAHVVWQEGYYEDIYYRRFNAPSGEWEDVLEISDDPGNSDQWRPAIAVRNGNVSIAWQDKRDNDWDIYYRDYRNVEYTKNIIKLGQEICGDSHDYGMGGIKVDTDGYRVVYFSFDFLAINSSADRNMTMGRVLDWLIGLPKIIHTPLHDTEDTIGPYPVTATITSLPLQLNTSSIFVYYSTDGANYTQLPMSTTGNPNEYSANIPGQPDGTTVFYYISAGDIAGKIVTHPLGANESSVESMHSFYVGTDTTPPTIIHKPYRPLIGPDKPTAPYIIEATITDNGVLNTSALYLYYNTSESPDYKRLPMMPKVNIGEHSAGSGDISDNQESWMKKTIIGPGVLTFYWKVNSEPSYDFLKLYIDNIYNCAISGNNSGNIDWFKATIPISVGMHTIMWKYTKDEYYTEGQDRGWVDNIELKDDNGYIIFSDDFDDGNLDGWITGGDADWLPAEDKTRHVSDLFSADIPEQLLGTTVNYYIEATDTASSPNTAREPSIGTHSFSIVTGPKIALDRTYINQDYSHPEELEYYENALKDAGYKYYTIFWPYNQWSNYDIVIKAGSWSDDDAYTHSDLETYLNNGGHLYIAASDLGSKWGTTSFYTNYLKCTYDGLMNLFNENTANGVPGDPISDNLDIAINTQGCYNIEHFNTQGDEIYTLNSRNVSMKYDSGTYKVVYQSVPFAYLDSAVERATLIDRIIKWLEIPPAEENDVSVWSINSPINGQTYSTGERNIEATIVNCRENPQTDFNVSCEITDIPQPAEILYFDDFESGLENWTTYPDYTNWVHSSEDPYSGNHCAQVLFVEDSFEGMKLTLDLTSASTPVYLEFWLRDYFFSSYAEAPYPTFIFECKIQNETSGTTLLQKLDPYYGFYDCIDGWSQHCYEISEYAGSVVSISFEHTSGNPFISTFCIDDVCVKVIPAPTTVFGPVNQTVTTTLAKYDTTTLTWNYNFVNPGRYRININTWLPGDIYVGNDRKTIEILIVPLQTFDIELSAGWNLISIPLVQANTSIQAVLSSIDGKWDVVQYYDATDGNDHWKSYSTFKPASLNDFWDINRTIAVWIHTTEACTLIVNGTVPASTSIPLYAGWNLVGYPTLTEKTISEALVGTGYDGVEGFNATAPYRTSSLDDTYLMKPGEGYWVLVPADTIWIIN